VRSPVLDGSFLSPSSSFINIWWGILAPLSPSIIDDLFYKLDGSRTSHLTL
jgi:hypothetical protein